MKTLLATTILSAGLMFPAFAQMSDDMTCADFVAMDEAGQMEAMASMESDDMASDDMASDDMEMSAADVAEACAADPDMTVTDVMESAM